MKNIFVQKKRKPIFSIATLILSFLLIYINITLSKFPKIIDKFYSNGFNKFIRENLNKTTSILPFSLCELLILVFLIFLVVQFIRFIKSLFSRDLENKNTFKIFKNTTITLFVLYSLFLILWGFNYNKSNILDNLKDDNTYSNYSNLELINLCEKLIEDANYLRKNLNEDDNKVFKSNKTLTQLSLDLKKGYKNISSEFPFLDGFYGNPKKAISSKLMSYMGISGFYFPYTGEININMNNSDFMLPSTLAHEIAHQKGIAKEDEANFLAYLVCINHPEDEIKYSGTMLALIHSMNTLYERDNESYKKLVDKYSLEVSTDLKSHYELWASYSGPLDTLFTKYNNLFLASNGQKQGVESYANMVDLIINYDKIKKNQAK